MNQLNSLGSTLLEIIEQWLNDLGMSPGYSEALKFLIIIVILVLICAVSDYVAKKVILKVIQQFVRRTKTDWDDILFEKKVFNRLAHLVPALLLESLVPIFLKGYPGWIEFGLKTSHIYLIVGVIALLVALSRVGEVLIARHPFAKDKPIESYMQLVRIVFYVIGGIYLMAVLIDKSPWGIFSALGAMSVVLMLVFRDTILGLVASIQIAANDMVKVGDWVEFPKYGADGDVIEIKLQTIKIRNWDKTISTVPTYAFVSDAFKNWRGMEESDGRRIKRSINIDLNTIRLCDEEMLGRYEKITYIADYIKEKAKDIDTDNQANNIDKSSLVNGRHLTNVGTFRAYVEAYLKQHEQINKDMTFLVRQLQATEKGLPLEVYVFSKDKRWSYYEGIQADIFDHLLSIIKEFDLAVYQQPSGADFQSLAK